MAHQIDRHDVASWLLRNGFEERARVGIGSGHRYFTHVATGVKVVLPGHGRNDLTKKVAGHVMRQLSLLGFDKERVRAELR